MIATGALAGCGSGAGSDNDASANEKWCEQFPPDEITLVVPFPPGGGYDAWARLMAPFMEEILGEGVTVKVQNMPGGGGMSATNSVYAAKPDGSRLLFIEPGEIISNQIAGNVVDGFDVTDFVFTGGVTIDPQVFFVAADSDINSMNDIRGEEVKMGTQQIKPQEAITFEEMGVEPQYILHEGTSDVVLAVRRGDVDISRLSLASVAPYIEAGEVKAISQMTMEDLAENQPLAAELKGIDNLATLGLEKLNPVFDYRRVIAAPPGTPACIADTLEETLLEMTADEEFVAKANEAGLVVDGRGSEETTEVVKSSFELASEYEKPIREALGIK